MENEEEIIFEPIKPEEIICLHITSWAGISINAEHYYAELKGYYWGNKDAKNIELERIIESIEEAQYLNKKNHCDRRGGYIFKVGTKISMFTSRKQAVREAKKQYKNYFPDAKVILLGDRAECAPQEMILGPRVLKKYNNQMWRLHEKLYKLEEKGKISEEERFRLQGVVFKAWQLFWPVKFGK